LTRSQHLLHFGTHDIHSSDIELIEELPLDDDHPDRGSRVATVYAGREAR
jgi:hypothetical protein